MLKITLQLLSYETFLKLLIIKCRCLNKILLIQLALIHMTALNISYMSADEWCCEILSILFSDKIGRFVSWNTFSTPTVLIHFRHFLNSFYLMFSSILWKYLSKQFFQAKCSQKLGILYHFEVRINSLNEHWQHWITQTTS